VDLNYEEKVDLKALLRVHLCVTGDAHELKLEIILHAQENLNH
jgi:hypothetical protein